MSRSELIDAYQNGRITRRAFVRGMMALGLSVSVATAMADKVRATPASRALGRAGLAIGDDTYDDTYPTAVPTATGGTTKLPATGSPSAESGMAWTKPMAVLGAGVALAAGLMRRGKSEDEKATGV